MKGIKEKIMSKELFKEIIEELVDEKTVEQIIGDRVNYLLEINFERAMRNKAQELANLVIMEKIGKIIDEYFLKEVVVNDGWNPSKKYNSFEELVKKRIFETTNTYSIERIVERRVDNKIKEACKKVVKENTEKFADQVLKNLGGKNE